MEEVWKCITVFKRAFVSNEGNVKNRLIWLSNSGYKQIKLFGKNAYVHRVVFEHFKGEIPPHTEINHKDGNKLNNHIDNLEAVTSSQNKKHAHSLGLYPKQNLHGALNPNYRHGKRCKKATSPSCP